MAWGFIATSSLILDCMAIPPIRNWLSGAASTHLGKISSPFYLMHGPVLCFIGEPLMRRFGARLLPAVSIQLAVIVLSFAAVYASVAG